MPKSRSKLAQVPPLPWWLTAGEEECPQCGQFYIYELEYRCPDCDAPCCPMCRHTHAGICVGTEHSDREERSRG